MGKGEAVFTTHVYAGRDGRMTNMGTTYNGNYNGGGLLGSRSSTRTRRHGGGGGGGDPSSAAPMVLAASAIITMVIFSGWCMEELRMNHVYRSPYNGTCDIADSYIDTWVRPCAVLCCAVLCCAV